MRRLQDKYEKIISGKDDVLKQRVKEKASLSDSLEESSKLIRELRADKSAIADENCELQLSSSALLEKHKALIQQLQDLGVAYKLAQNTISKLSRQIDALEKKPAQQDFASVVHFPSSSLEHEVCLL